MSEFVSLLNNERNNETHPSPPDRQCLMNKPRTQQQIDAEIKALEACKTYIPRTTAFGDNNHRNVDLQIAELRNGIDDTAEEWDGYSEREQSAIMEARYWKEGDEEESPSSGWDQYKPGANPKTKRP